MSKVALSSVPTNLKFGPFTIPPSQVFHVSKSRLSYGLVNLKPLLPGHVLICPVRSGSSNNNNNNSETQSNVSRLSNLSTAETTDLFLTVRRVSFTLRRLYKATSFNVAVQDGEDAGQSVPHVHVHVIPRVRNDMAHVPGGGDAVYEMMDGEEGDVGAALAVEEWLKRRAEWRSERKKQFGGPDVDDGGEDEKGDDLRKGRSLEEMKIEAEWLRDEMSRDEEAYRDQNDEDNDDDESSADAHGMG